MKTATLRDLRNHFSKLEAWLREGEDIEIRRRKEVVAILTRPPSEPHHTGSQLPDFQKRRQTMGLRPLQLEDLQRIQEFEEEGLEG